MNGVDIESMAAALNTLMDDKNHLAIEDLREQFQKMGGIAEAAAQLRLTVLDFMDWRERRILWHPWLLFRGRGYWGKRFDEFCLGRWEQAIVTELWKAVELGKTTFLDLAARMVRNEQE